MKKVLAILSAASLIISLAACSGQDSSSKAQQSPQSSAEQPTTVPEENTGVKVIDDRSVAGMEFSPPKSYKSASRNIVESVNGSVFEKDMIYILDGENVLKVIVMAATKLEDVINTGSYKEKVNQDGVTFYTVKEGRYASAYAENGGNTYIINFTASTVDPSYDEYDALLKSVKFTDAELTSMNSFDLYDVTFDADRSDSLYGYTIAQQEDPQGEVMTKSISLNCGSDTENIDYSIRVKVFRNKTVEQAFDEVYSEKPETEEKTVNSIKYTVALPKEDSGETKPHAYYTQHGADTYAVYNDGGGTFELTRPDESWADFDALLKSISFK